MRKLILYSAQSLNGMIARSDGRVDWLDDIDHPQGEDYGYAKFYDSIDCTLMGNNTYKQVLGFGGEFPYKVKNNFVFTRNKELTQDEHVKYVSDDILEFVRKLKEEKGSNIWLVGGGQLNTFLHNAMLIDEIHIHIMPIIIPEGIALFPEKPLEVQYRLKSTKSFTSGVLECVYTNKNKG